MDENKIKKTGFRIGSFLATICAMCLATCIMACAIAFTYRFVVWMIGGIL